MFGYISINKAEMKFKDYDVYHSFYCGLCKVLKDTHKRRGQMTLSYDMTFLLVLLSGLYEPETTVSCCNCIAHPFEKHTTRINEFTGYVADMNLLLSYYKCKDDWVDERKKSRYIYYKMLTREVRKIEADYPAKVEVTRTTLEEISVMEQNDEQDIDKISGCFGNIMAEIFALRADEWEQHMRTIGFYLGKFIYLLDAYDDIEKDLEAGTYNPFKMIYQDEGFEERCYSILTMMMSECSRAFEKLPIIEHIDILRNILYSGVWCRYETIREKRKENQENNHAGSV